MNDEIGNGAVGTLDCVPVNIEKSEKATRPGRLPHYVRKLKALDDDGYFNP